MPERQGRAAAGAKDAGDFYNLYTSDCILACNESAPLIVHGMNFAKFQYSDDGTSISIRRPDTQRLIDVEANELHKVNMRLSRPKSALFKYSRNKRVRAEMDSDPAEPPLHAQRRANARPKSQVQKILGCLHDFDELDFSRKHFDEKVHTFHCVSSMLYNQKVLGDSLSREDQIKCSGLSSIFHHLLLSTI